MDAILTALIGAAPQLGVGGVLVVLFTILLRSQSTDRADQRTLVKETDERHTRELGRLSTAHDVELAELRTEIMGLRRQIEDLNQRLDMERDRRRAAEDQR